jgi:hypothetical protein
MLGCHAYLPISSHHSPHTYFHIPRILLQHCIHLFLQLYLLLTYYRALITTFSTYESITLPVPSTYACMGVSSTPVPHGPSTSTQIWKAIFNVVEMLVFATVSCIPWWLASCHRAWNFKGLCEWKRGCEEGVELINSYCTKDRPK